MVCFFGNDCSRRLIFVSIPSDEGKRNNDEAIKQSSDGRAFSVARVHNKLVRAGAPRREYVYLTSVFVLLSLYLNTCGERTATHPPCGLRAIVGIGNEGWWRSERRDDQTAANNLSFSHRKSTRVRVYTYNMRIRLYCIVSSVPLTVHVCVCVCVWVCIFIYVYRWTVSVRSGTPVSQAPFPRTITRPCVRNRFRAADPLTRAAGNGNVYVLYMYVCTCFVHVH